MPQSSTRSSKTPRAPQGAGRVPRSRAAAWSIPAFVVLGLAMALGWSLPVWLVGWYGVLSILCAAAYALDKRAAVRGGWRTRESTLLALGLVGGWPGAVVAQQLLRHKTSKLSFRRSFWTTVVVNVVALVLLCSPVGEELLSELTRSLGVG